MDERFGCFFVQEPRRPGLLFCLNRWPSHKGPLSLGCFSQTKHCFFFFIYFLFRYASLLFKQKQEKHIPWQPNPTSFPWFTSPHFLPSIWTCTVELDEAANQTEISPLDLVGLGAAGATPLSPCTLTDVTKLGKGPQNQDRTQQPGLEQT